MSPAAQIVKAMLYASLIVTKPKPRLKAEEWRRTQMVEVAA